MRTIESSVQTATLVTKFKPCLIYCKVHGPGIFLGIMGQNPGVSQVQPVYMLPSFGYVCRTKTIHQLLCFKSKFRNHFVFTLGCYCSCYFWSSLFDVDVNYSYMYISN